MRYASLAHTGHPEPATVVRRDLWASWGGLALLIIGCNAIPAVAALLLDRGAPFEDLALPWWTPRAEALAVAAVVSYTAMAVATWLIVRQRDLVVMMRW